MKEESSMCELSFAIALNSLLCTRNEYFIAAAERHFLGLWKMASFWLLHSFTDKAIQRNKETIQIMAMKKEQV